MPGGSDPLISLQWQPVPGCPGVQVYPFTRKVDTISSNAYLLDTPEVIVLIDPGGLPEQTAHLAAVIGAIQAEPPRPILMMLTHAHTDHFLAARTVPEWADPATTMVAIQEQGAEALESSDRKVTQAEILEQELTPVRIDLRLFPAAKTPIRRTFANGTMVTVLPESPEHGLAQERILLGNGPHMEVYHTPGHSPDSSCILIGELLFIGDLLFAAVPGMAGICGWNQEALIHSLTGMQALLSRGGITTVCPGHGRVLTAEDTAQMLGAVLRDAHHLSDIAEMNHERSRTAAIFAEDCMEQVHELFTVMSGRLYYVSYVLDELGETEAAAGLPTLIRGEVIDDLLDSFSAFTRAYHAGRGVPLHLALKGGQVIGKLQRSFEQGPLSQIIDPTLVQRAERLLYDYTTMLRGFDPPRDLAVHDLSVLLKTCLADHGTRPHSDEEILAATEDETAFGRLLLARIGTPPLLEDVAVTFKVGIEPQNVSVDQVRFLDLVTYLLEDLVGTGATAVTVRTWMEGGAIVATLSGTCEGTLATCGGRPRRFLYWLCERAGGILRFDDTAGIRQYVIRFPSIL